MGSRLTVGSQIRYGNELMADSTLPSTPTQAGPVLHVGDRPVGAGCATFVVAEVGVNHNGDGSLAAELVDFYAPGDAKVIYCKILNQGVRL